MDENPARFFGQSKYYGAALPSWSPWVNETAPVPWLCNTTSATMKSSTDSKLLAATPVWHLAFATRPSPMSTAHREVAGHGAGVRRARDAVAGG